MTNNRREYNFINNTKRGREHNIVLTALLYYRGYLLTRSSLLRILLLSKHGCADHAGGITQCAADDAWMLGRVGRAILMLSHLFT